MGWHREWIRKVRGTRGGSGPKCRFSIPTSVGVFRGVFSGQGIDSLTFPRRKESAKRSFRIDEANSKDVKALSVKLRMYFRGRKISFEDVPVSFAGYSSFTAKVLKACRRIGYGQKICYEDLARRIGQPGAFRAVGTALGKNRVPILIPCHRVISKDGSIGGYSSGRQWKKILLGMEGISVPEGAGRV